VCDETSIVFGETPSLFPIETLITIIARNSETVKISKSRGEEAV
jgi:hypothetical protein